MNGRVTRELFEPVCTMRQRRVHRARVLRFVSLFTLLLSPSFRCCPTASSFLTPRFLPIRYVPLSSLVFVLERLLFKFERFFFPSSLGEGMQDALRGLMITRRFDADRTMLVRMNISFDIGCEYWRERWNRGNESFESEYNSGWYACKRKFLSNLSIALFLRV